MVLIGALLAPWLYWGAQWLAARHIATGLTAFDFETFFHRALLVAALVLLWPLLRSLRCRRLSDLDLAPNPRWLRDLLAGLAMAVVPLVLLAAALVALHSYSLRNNPNFPALAKLLPAAMAVPLIEEALFRGLILGVLLRAGRTWAAMLATSAFFSVIHFLKAPAETSSEVTWWSGFNSIGHAFAQFSDPMLVLAGFTTLLLIGLILADARVRTRSLWLPIGLHGGWILAAGIFGKVTRRQTLLLPWLGKNLLVGLLPLGVGLLTWLLVILWLKHDRARPRP